MEECTSVYGKEEREVCGHTVMLASKLGRDWNDVGRKES